MSGCGCFKYGGKERYLRLRVIVNVRGMNLQAGEIWK